MIIGILIMVIGIPSLLILFAYLLSPTTKPKEKKLTELQEIRKKQKEKEKELRDAIYYFYSTPEITTLVRKCRDLIEVMDENDRVNYTSSFLNELNSIAESDKISRAIGEDNNELIKGLLNTNIKIYTEIVRTKHIQSTNYLEALEELKQKYVS